MAVVITVAQQKGGAGKTTLAANLAAALSGGRRVAALDIDPQRSLTRWAELRQAQKLAGPVTASDVSGWRIKAELDRLARAHDVVVVDSPPQIDTDARLAVRAADLVLVPIQPSAPDMWAAEGTLKLATAEGRTARLVMNRAPASSKLRTEIEAGHGKLLLAHALGNRVGFANAFARGLGVTEAAPRSLAATELQALADEIAKLLKLG